jgi:hypothetical protein
MLSRNSVLVCCIILLSILCTGCKDIPLSTGGSYSNLDTSSFIYPFKNGSSWNYSRVYKAFNFRPDSVRRFFNFLPLYAGGTTTILYDSVINGITVKCFFNSYSENSYHFESREYYGNYDSGLVCFGYRDMFGTEFTPFAVSGVSYSYNGYRFYSVRQIFRMFENKGLNFNSSDSVILEIPPVLCFKYPVITGVEWFFKNVEGFDIITKKYRGFENIVIGSGYYSCMKTERIWSTMTDLELYDYYSRAGILKRDYTIRDILIMNEFGDTLGLADFNDLYNVTSFNIPPE